MEYMRETDMEQTADFSRRALEKALKNKEVLCARALVYEKGVGLHFNLGGYRAVMPTEEVIFSADGAPAKEVAVVTRVNKNVCFIITGADFDAQRPTLTVSRRAAQKMAYEEYISHLKTGDVIPCTVTHVDNFGVFCDIAMGISALMPIDFISVSRINSPADRFSPGDKIFACVKSIDSQGRIVLTHKELLGTWMQNAEMFTPLTTVSGTVRSIENYGIFIELAPNLAGLAEVCEGIQVGQKVNVYIKSILPDKMKVKLVIMSIDKADDTPPPIKYFIKSGHIDSWVYSTVNCKKQIKTDFI